MDTHAIVRRLIGISFLGLVAGSGDLVEWCQPGLGKQPYWCFNATRNSYDIPQQGGLDIACLLKHNHGLGSFKYGQEFTFPFECCQNTCEVPFCSFHPKCQDSSAPETTTVTVTPIGTIAGTGGHPATSCTTYTVDSSTFTYAFGANAVTPMSAPDSVMPTSTDPATKASSSDHIEPRQASDTTQAATGPSSANTTVSSTANAVLYVFASKYNTSQTTFNDYVKGLDNSVGSLISYPGNPWQAYQTKLNDAQVADVKAQPWLDWISAVPPSEFNEDYQDSRAVSPNPHQETGSTSDEISSTKVNATQELHKRAAELAKRAIVTRNPTLASQLKLISAPYPVANNTQPDFSQNYRFDSSLGAGTTIYIVDAGFNLDAADLAATGRTVGRFVVPNERTLPNNFEGPVVAPGGAFTDTPLPEDITDRTADTQNANGTFSPGRGHGTGVASAAAGLTYGVASRANLYLIKAKNGITRSYSDGSGRPDKVLMLGYQLDAVISAINEVIYHVVGNSNYGKAVVNFSWGIAGTEALPVTVGSPLWIEFQKLLEFANENGIIVVCAAGNLGRGSPEALGYQVPQRLGTSSNNLITVGGLNSDATFWDGTIPAGSANYPGNGEGEGVNPGSISVWAQATSVTKETKTGVDSTQDFGTSYSSPEVAGLAAYFLAFPPSGQPYQQDTVSQQMKTDIQSYAYAYRPGYPSANNGARGTNQQLCSRQDGGGCTSFTFTGGCTYVDILLSNRYDFHIDELEEPGKCPTQLSQFESCFNQFDCAASDFDASCASSDYPNGVSGTFRTPVTCEPADVSDCLADAFGYLPQLVCNPT